MLHGGRKCTGGRMPPVILGVSTCGMAGHAIMAVAVAAAVQSPRTQALRTLTAQATTSPFSPCARHHRAASAWMLAEGEAASRGPVLLIGCSGGTGGRAVRGFLDAGYSADSLRVATRDTTKPSSKALAAAGVSLVRLDLDDETTLPAAIDGCERIYVHGTAGDTKQLDEAEVERAEALAAAIAADGRVRHLVFNSYAAEADCGVRRIEQKHASEAVFAEIGNGLRTTNLRANLFMEELWKSYTRPAILKGKFPFSTPPDRVLYLTCVRDLGRIAGALLADGGDAGGTRTLNVASDALTAPQMAAAFAKAQGSACVHKKNMILYWTARLLLPDLYEVMRFYRTTKETTDIGRLDAEFPNALTPLARFLEETEWRDAKRTYEDLTRW